MQYVCFISREDSSFFRTDLEDAVLEHTVQLAETLSEWESWRRDQIRVCARQETRHDALFGSVTTYFHAVYDLLMEADEPQWNVRSDVFRSAVFPATEYVKELKTRRLF